MTLRICERDFESFFEAPFAAYGDESLYVSPLKSDLHDFLSANKNPLFKCQDSFTYFTVHQDEKVLGRIVAHVHEESNTRHDLNRAYFGFFDCSDDDEAATALLNAAEDWAKAQGFNEIVGNFNLTIAQQIGVTTSGFENSPFVDMIYSPAHISQQLEKNGYAAFFPTSTTGTSLSSLTEDNLISPRQQKIFDDTDYDWKPVNRFTLKKRLIDARILLNDAFSNNPMFVTLSAEEFTFQTQSLASIIDPRISKVVYYKGDPVGVVICIPDVNPMLKSIKSRLGLKALFAFIKHHFFCKRAVIIYYAVSPEMHGRGINSAMVYRVIQSLKKAGYKELGGTWVSDTNLASLRVLEKINSAKLHGLHLYRKDIVL